MSRMRLGVIPLMLTGCFEVNCELTGDCPLPTTEPWDATNDGSGGSGYGYGTSDNPLDDGFEDAVEIVSVRDCSVTVRHPPVSGVSEVAVSGEFNNWMPQL